MENLCLLLGGHAVERTAVGRLYAGVLFHENLGHAACLPHPCHSVSLPPRQAPGGLRGTCASLCPGQGEVLVWVQVGSIEDQTDLEPDLERSALWLATVFLPWGSAGAATVTSYPYTVPVHQGTFVPPSAGTGYQQQVKGSWWPKASQELYSFPGQHNVSPDS